MSAASEEQGEGGEVVEEEVEATPLEQQDQEDSLEIREEATAAPAEAEEMDVGE